LQHNLININRKGQIKGLEKGEITAQVKFAAQIFGVAA
jgi:hypothetical protein